MFLENPHYFALFRSINLQDFVKPHFSMSQAFRLASNTTPRCCVKEDVPSWKLKSAVTDSSSWRLLRFAPIWLPPWRKTFLHFAKWWQSDSSWDAVSSSPLFWREIFHFWQKEFDRENASLKNQFDFVFTCFYFDTENVHLWRLQCCQNCYEIWRPKKVCHFATNCSSVFEI